MKRLLTLVILSVGLVANAQSTNTPTGFLGSVRDYFLTHNLNLTNTFGAHKGEAWTSMDSIQGNASTQAKLADAVGLQYTVYDHLSLENVLRTSGIAGTIVTEQFGLGLNFIVIDTKLSLYADAGYDKEKSLFIHSKFKDDLFGEIGIRVKKALTDNTFAGVGLGVRVPDATQVYQVMAGFTF